MADTQMVAKIGDYEIVSELGSGTFATVKHGRHKLTQTDVAIKIIPKNNFADPDHIMRFHRELDLIKDMDHQFIAEFFELVEDEHNYYIIMEYVANGNLLDYVNINGELNENQARHYFCQLISALEYLHTQKNVAHRDLKAENVLLDRNYNIRLIDFGLSNVFTTDNPFLQTACGSPAYASPEMVRGQKYTVASDIWSAGVLLYAMVSGELPFSDENIQRLLQKVIFTEPKYPSTISPQLRDLLQRLLQKDSDSRITLQKIKEHPWFSHSEYAMQMDMNFGIENRWRLQPNTMSKEYAIDKEIVNFMSSLNIDCQGMVNALLCKENNKATAVYKMLWKDKVTDQMNKLTVKRPRNSLSLYLSNTSNPASHGVPPIPRPLSSKGDSSPRSPLPSPCPMPNRQIVPPICVARPRNPGSKAILPRPTCPIPNSPKGLSLTPTKNTQQGTPTPVMMQMRRRASSFREQGAILKPI